MTALATVIRTIREDMKRAVRAQDAALALKVVNTIREHDLYVSQPSNPVDYARRIKSNFPAVCQYRQCRRNIPKGSDIMWVRSAGSWDVDCFYKAGADKEFEVRD